MAVLKANAYGHGILPIAKYLNGNQNIDCFAVAFIEEAIQLRKENIQKPILVLGAINNKQIKMFLKYDTSFTGSSEEKLEAISLKAKKLNKIAKVHLKIDTGMHRLGIPFEEYKQFLTRLKTFENLSLEGLMSHMISAGSRDSEWNNLQISRFKDLIKNWELILDKKPKFIHLENSAGFFNFNMDFTNVSRLGIAIYGYGHEGLKPVLRLYSVVKDIKNIKAGETVSYGGWYRAEKDSKIALIPVGYGDGFMRGHRKGSVLINGLRFPIVGVICMDYFIVDITGAVNTKVGDRVTIIGEENSASGWAKVSGTIVYEVLTLLNPRIRRLYSNGND